MNSLNYQSNFTSIPIVDLQLINQDYSGFISYIRDICHHVGFFYLVNHGISSEKIALMLNQAQALFQLPQEVKESLSINQSAHYRGYGALNAEITKGLPDFKETFDLGLERTARLSAPSTDYEILHGPNQWPPALMLPKFKYLMIEYLHAMQQLGCTIMHFLAESLGLTPKMVDDLFHPASENAYAILRLLRYPPGGEKLGVGPHTDAGFLVFLLQDEVGGLEVKNQQGDWVSAPPKENAFIVNIGEMLEVWSGGYYRATEHRVINATNQERISAPFFYEPHLNSAITPLGDPTIESPIIYGERMLRIFQRSYPAVI